MPDIPTLVAVAHGTRDLEGPVVITELLDKVRARLPGVEVRVAYVDVIGPTLAEVFADLSGPAIVVPMFLASGYHVRVDIPRTVKAADGAVVAAALGPDEAVATAVEQRLRSVGPLPEAVVLAAAGSSDASALAEVEVAARMLSERLHRPVVTGYLTTASPTVAVAVKALRAASHSTIGVAPYLLAPGLFSRRLAEVEADMVAAPIGAHDRVAELIVHRYLSVLNSSGVL